MAMILTFVSNSLSGCTQGNLDAAVASCSGRGVTSTGNLTSRYEPSGAGSDTAVFSFASSETNVVTATWWWTPDTGITWDAGDWTVRFNVTSSNMNLTITEIHLCQVSSACANVATLGSATGLSIALSTTGVKTQTVTQGSTATPSAGDKLLIVFVGTNGAMSSQSATITHDQNIDSPFTAASFTPAVDKFRFYDDDAGEDASTPLAAEDTNVTINVDSGNVPFQLRYRLQESGGVAGAATDDYDLQRSLNSGGYSTITGATTAIITSASGLTNDAATTNRATNGITNGTGSFVAGEQSTDGVLDNWQLTASNYSEIVYGGTVVAADVNNNDTIDFRVTLNGGTPGMTNSVTPRITIQKTPPTTTQFFMLLGVGT